MVVVFTHVRSNKQIVWGDDPIATFVLQLLFPHYFSKPPLTSGPWKKIQISSKELHKRVQFKNFRKDAPNMVLSNEPFET